MKRLMKRVLSFWSVVILSLGGVLALAEDRAGTPMVENVRLGVDAKGQTRIVLDLDASPSYEVTAAAPAAPTLRMTVAGGIFGVSQADLPAPRGIIQSLAIDGNVLEIRLEETGLPVKSFVLPPQGAVKHHRLVVDVEKVSAVAFAAVAIPPVITGGPADAAPNAPAVVQTTADAKAPPAPSVAPAAQIPREILVLSQAVPPAPTVKPRRNATRQEKQNITIVLDPGHGGYDPGALGSTGIKEKDITLSAAKVLRTVLQGRGYDVILTRGGDSYVDHEDRINLARGKQADMFISIHADANPVASARGASVYTLSEDRSAKMANDVAASGDFRVFDVDVSETDRDVSSILFDLANTDTKNQSTRLAEALITEMRRKLPMVRNTHRHAGLLVLLSPDVPAVLVELAFLSNEKDEANLSSSKWRKVAVTSIADGIDRYFADPSAVRTVSTEIAPAR